MGKSFRWMLLGIFVATQSMFGCSRFQPVDLDPEMAAAPLNSPFWQTVSQNRPGQWFHTLNTGREALDWRLRMIDTAADELDLQTFLWLPDVAGLAVMERTLQAADRGVRVRILLDDTFTVGETSMLRALAEHPRIELRLYNPFEQRPDSFMLRQILNLGEFHRVDRRMHNKLMVIDGRAALIGGRNLADEYFGLHESANFRDMEVIAFGDVVPTMAGTFDLYWNSGFAVPVERVRGSDEKRVADLDQLRDALAGSEVILSAETGAYRLERWLALAEQAYTGVGTVVADLPADREHPDRLPVQLGTQLSNWLDDAEQEVTLVSAYLIPTDELEGAIERAERRGVEVTILTNSLLSNNHLAAHAAYRGHIRTLMRNGADLREVRARARDRGIYMDTPIDEKRLGLHAKFLTIDSHLTFIGSANLDPRSLRLNTEIGLLIDSESLNAHIRDLLELDVARRNAWHLEENESGGIRWVSDDEILDKQPADTPLQRLEDWLIGLLPIDGEM